MTDFWLYSPNDKKNIPLLLLRKPEQQDCLYQGKGMNVPTAFFGN